ncbi:hypothetical protein [Engelhardtia mirabilis]
MAPNPMTKATARPRRPLRFVLRAGLALLSAAMGLFAVEWGVRRVDAFGIAYYREVPAYFAEAIVPFLGPDGLPDPQGRIFQQKPGVSLEFVDFDFITDSAGLRSDDPAATVPARVGPPTPGEGAWSSERWLFLGDSVTLAWGVDDADSWVRRFEAEARAVDGRPIEALNAGHLMYETVQQADLLATIGPLLAPDVVALCFISNDLEPTYDVFIEQVAEAQRLAAQRRGAGLLAHAADAIGRRFVGLAGVLRYLRERDTAAEGHASRSGPMRLYPANWPRCAGALDSIVANCASLGARFVLIDHSMPPLPDLPTWAAAAGVDYVRVGFEPADWARGIVNSKVDAHANALGNRIIAVKVLAGLRALGRIR